MIIVSRGFSLYFFLLWTFLLVLVVYFYTLLPENEVNGTPVFEERKFISSNFAVSKQLGNNIFELASILGISRVLHRTPVIFLQNSTYQYMLNRVIQSIPGLLEEFLVLNETVPDQVVWVDFNRKCCTFENPQKLKNWKLQENEIIYLTGLYYQSFKYFPNMRSELRGFLETSEKFPTLPKSDNKNYVTCVHIRRSDFFDVGFHVGSEKSIREVIGYIKTNVTLLQDQKVSFVIFGDDINFMRSLIQNQVNYYLSENSDSEDLAYAKKNCDAVFISSAHSTFGWWMGYLSKGNQVYYADIRGTNDSVYKTGDLKPDDYYLPHWIPVKVEADIFV
ncbi:L-Fucosyltransferase [Caenorhabditis elegans]|uniref:L-Fucosyltransferase n=1 Tax=Caenorhabditis elegans TaxID=6239 RepID=Q9XU09_CAEEL|nr:L-Fucosyltransferase [Caenorhabditis elegans]CAB07284.2 L-Fucosyltransferase [Caenorhabditis elegans]